jgi:hypothetical protein
VHFVWVLVAYFFLLHSVCHFNGQKALDEQHCMRYFMHSFPTAQCVRSFILLVLLLIVHTIQPLSQEDASFVPGKQLTQKDMILIDMLSGNEDKGVCWVITDPQLPDNPIIYSSEGFCAYTQYLKSEIEGQNCRFLQGQGTDPKDVERIREGMATYV